MQNSLSLFSAEEEARLYHDAGRFGFFSILYAANGRKHQKSCRLPLMPEVLPLLPADRDTWLSQGEFTQPNRRIVNLARISMLFVDLDCYCLTPETGLSKLLWHCDDEGLPHPSIVVFSGRGLQAKWLLDQPLPRWALPRWNAVQSQLVEKFMPLNADPNAKDASRVLRLVHTTNSKSGEKVRVIHTTQGTDGEPLRYDFDFLAEWLLPNCRDAYDKKAQNHPFSHDEMIAMAVAREARQLAYDARKLKLIRSQNTPGDGFKRFSGRQLAWHRLEDIRKLVEIRGGVRQGQSMPTLFWSLNFLLLSGATNSSQIHHEAAALCKEFGFGEFQRHGELSTLLAKAKDHEAGRTVTFNGKVYPPLYTPKNERLIELFEITSEEQQKLRTIISRDEASNRHAARERERRRNAGSVDRHTYLSTNTEKRVQARLMKAQGKSIREIAANLSVSVGSVHGWLK